MTSPYELRTAILGEALGRAEIDIAILADPDSIAYYGGYWNYLGIEFGRPTLLVVAGGRSPVIITPLMEAQMCAAMSWITDVRPWSDGGEEWQKPLADLVQSLPRARIGIEVRSMPNVVAAEIRRLAPDTTTSDVGPIIAFQRMIKSQEELTVMRHAGEVAVTMMDAARETIGEDVPEFEIALAAMAAGTRKAAQYLTDPADRFVSPLIHNLQVLQSSGDTCMVHRRASTRRLAKGDPIYLCFCGMVSFRNYKLGFDRQFFVGGISDEQARVQEAAVAAQRAALSVIRPGISCQAVNEAAEEAYAAAGFEPGYRTGRAIGVSLLEPPELKRGDETLLRPGMTFAVDGGITVPGRLAGRIGDSIAVTDDGFEWLTPYSRDLTVI